MMIDDLQAGYYRIPLATTLSDSTHGDMSAFELVTVRLRDADGVEGLGYAYTVHVGGRAVHTLIEHDLKPLLLGADADLIEALWQKMWWRTHFIGRGGLAAMADANRRKAEKLYAAIDESAFYSNPVQQDCRSWMNVPFVLPDATLDSRFLADAELAGLKNLKGHRLVGGMRASIYNAMPEAGVDALISFMRDFEKASG